MFLQNLINKLHESLYHHKEALEYLKNRMVSEEEIKEFKIGYSRNVVAVDDGSEDFICFKNETFRGKALEGKVVLPIFDILGNPAGLLGRSINSKDFKLYLTQESKFLGAFFGLPQALPHIYETGMVFTVEGPFDLLAFRRVFPNVVATLTAELTDAQFEQLSFFAPNIVTVFDSDKAGINATERAKKKWPEEYEKRRLRAISLGYKDPDGVLKFYGDFKKYSEHVKRKVNGVLWM
jgi:DNA primase